MWKQAGLGPQQRRPAEAEARRQACTLLGLWCGVRWRGLSPLEPPRGAEGAAFSSRAEGPLAADGGAGAEPQEAVGHRAALRMRGEIAPRSRARGDRAEITRDRARSGRASAPSTLPASVRECTYLVQQGVCYSLSKGEAASRGRAGREQDSRAPVHPPPLAHAVVVPVVVHHLEAGACMREEDERRLAVAFRGSAEEGRRARRLGADGGGASPRCGEAAAREGAGQRP